MSKKKPLNPRVMKDELLEEQAFVLDCLDALTIDETYIPRLVWEGSLPRAEQDYIDLVYDPLPLVEI